MDGPNEFEKILSRFKARLSSEHTELFQLVTFDDLKASICKIQTEQAARKGLRNLSKIKPFLHGLEQYSKVIEVFVQAKPDILGVIWGPIKLCLQVASKVNEAFDALLDAYEKIGNSLPILSTVDALFCSHPHVKKILADIYEDVLDFHKRAIVFFKHGTWKLTFKLTYHTFSDMFEDTLKKLDRSRDLILQSANVAHFQDSQEARTLFAKSIQAALDEQQNQRRIAIMDWLSSETESATQHQELRNIRAMLPQTTRWIFSQPQMVGWLKRAEYSPCTLWLCGIPGAGKTVIFSSVIDEISATFPDAQVVYFYCKNNDPLRSNFTDIARSLISQILQINANCLDFIYDSMLTGGERRAKDPSKLLQILSQILKNHDSLYIGIDGLDECPEQERKLFAALISSSVADDGQANVRIIFTSRQEKDLEKSLKTAAKLNIKPQNLEKDIMAYIAFKMDQLCQKFDFTQERKQLISKEICTRPMGMFLLARLIMDNLLYQDNLEDLNEELRFEVLPHGINEAYGRMLVRIGKSIPGNPNQLRKRLERAKLVITLVTTSKRMLYAHEVQGALAINLDEQNVDFENRHSRSPLDDLCGPILEVHPNGIVDLIHPTAKEYLWQHHSNYFINGAEAEETMANLCTSYLAFDCFSPECHRDIFTTRVLSGDFAFQEYAACNWLKHAKSCLGATKNGKAIPKPLQTAVRILHERQDKNLTCSWEFESDNRANFDRVLSDVQRLYDKTDTISSDDSETQERVPYLLEQISHSRSVIEEQTIHNMGQENIDKFYGQTPFRCPILRCSYFVTGFRTLQERDKHLNSHRRTFMCPHGTCDYSELGFPSGSALKTHLDRYHEDLIQTPIFPDIRTRTLEQALEDAITANDLLAITSLATELATFPTRKTGFVLQALTLEYREAAIILLDLLATPSELEHVDKKKKMTALLKACETGDEEIFDILVKKGADINMCPEDSEAALTIASQNCQISIARKLLEDDKYQRSTSRANYSRVGALAMASTHGHLVAVALLLEKEWVEFAKRDSTDFNRALMRSIKEEKEPCAKALLDWALKKAPLKLTRKLRKLSRISHGDVIQSLYAEKSRVLEKDGGTKGNALQAAAYKGDLETVLYLLELGADINNLKGGHGTPMMAAASNGKLEVVRLLLGRGADLMRKDDRKYENDWSAIDTAAAHGREAIVRELLDKGAYFTHESTRETTLQAVSRIANSAAVATLLLENGANVEGSADKASLQRPLSIAAEHGQIATMKVLLQYGADVNAKSGTSRRYQDRTALHQAVSGGQPASIEILLEHGADINAINGKGQTALFMRLEVPGFRDNAKSREKHQQAIRNLIKRGINIETADKEGNTALMSAAEQKYCTGSETIQLLVESGANISTKNLAGSTALMIAARHGNFAGVEYLLQRITIQNIEGKGHEVWDALEKAIQRNEVKTARVLLEFLSAADLADYQDLLSTQLAFVRSKIPRYADMISLLEEYEASPVPPAQEPSVSQEFWHEFWNHPAVVENSQGDQSFSYPDQNFQYDGNFQMETGDYIEEQGEREDPFDDDVSRHKQEVFDPDQNSVYDENSPVNTGNYTEKHDEETLDAVGSRHYHLMLPAPKMEHVDMLL